MEKLRIYISLPITGREREAQEHADLVKASLSRQGHTPVSPFEINAGKDATYNDHICHDLHAMLDCDAIYFCGVAEFMRLLNRALCSFSVHQERKETIPIILRK